jgi:hypothetical protein
MLTQQYLFDVLRYDKDTGEFFRLKKTSNRIRVGEVAGTLLQDGYISISVSAKCYRAHRLAWFYMKGEWPVEQIDHINKNREDNRWCNLRLASPSQNRRNASKRSDNTSGYKGVAKNGKRWRAYAGTPPHHIGNYDTAKEAAMAYNNYVANTFGVFAAPNVL